MFLRILAVSLVLLVAGGCGDLPVNDVSNGNKQLERTNTRFAITKYGAFGLDNHAVYTVKDTTTGAEWVYITGTGQLQLVQVVPKY